MAITSLLEIDVKKLLKALESKANINLPESLKNKIACYLTKTTVLDQNTLNKPKTKHITSITLSTS